MTVVGVGNGMHPVWYFCSNTAYFFLKSNYIEIMSLSQGLAKSTHPRFSEYYRI